MVITNNSFRIQHSHECCTEGMVPRDILLRNEYFPTISPCLINVLFSEDQYTHHRQNGKKTSPHQLEFQANALPTELQHYSLIVLEGLFLIKRIGQQSMES